MAPARVDAMDAIHDKRALAVGLIRKAVQLLEQAGDKAGAATTQAALAAMLLTQPLAGLEIEPDAASLIVAMPLGPLA
ncbi:hypothetical protein [Sphingobium yanoikuyae]|jgi:hypothetical protein|nr:hypothetical protein [Sphingobium yanoikuyae]